ncbi:MAG: SGNH/GDSL hydrolase family protein [Acidimicrobiales bacterium]
MIARSLAVGVILPAVVAAAAMVIGAPGAPATASATAGASASASAPRVIGASKAPPPIPQPTASHPIRILEIGDSLGEDLGFGMSDVLGHDRLVRIIAAAVGDSGLARPDYYNWPAHLAVELHRYHPQAVVVMLGGDDGQSFIDNGRYVGFGTALWHKVYSRRVARLMNEATGAGAHVFWVGMPIMGSPALSHEMMLENQVFAQQALAHKGAGYFSCWRLFANAEGRYAQYLEDSSGHLVMERDPDGVHLTGAGADRLASAIVAPMQKLFGVRLGR